jgi:hypothetical protein
MERGDMDDRSHGWSGRSHRGVVHLGHGVCGHRVDSHELGSHRELERDGMDGPAECG